MKFNYIKLSASALIIFINILGVNTKPTYSEVTSHKAAIVNHMNLSAYSNTHHSKNNTIFSENARITLP